MKQKADLREINKHIVGKEKVKKKVVKVGGRSFRKLVRLWCRLESEAVKSGGRACLKRDTTMLFKTQLQQYIWRPL